MLFGCRSGPIDRISSCLGRLPGTVNGVIYQSGGYHRCDNDRHDAVHMSPAVVATSGAACLEHVPDVSFQAMAYLIHLTETGRSVLFPAA